MLTFKHLLFCTDFSENADFAFDFALDVAARYPGAMLHVLHVLPEPAAQFWRSYVNEVDNIDTRMREEIDARFADYQNRAPAGYPLQATVRFGRPDEQIIAYAKSAEVDLIILGRRGHGSFFFGNTAAQVAKSAECPVLVLPMDFKRRASQEPQ